MCLIIPSRRAVPYRERLLFLPKRPAKSYAPLIKLKRTVGRSLALPPRARTRLYFDGKLPIPGRRAYACRLVLYTVSLATCLNAELGFFGVMIVSRKTKALRWGPPTRRAKTRLFLYLCFAIFQTFLKLYRRLYKLLNIHIKLKKKLERESESKQKQYEKSK